ncbi:hypothetical protein BST61_g9444 [Cercospora zeina]
MAPGAATAAAAAAAAEEDSRKPHELAHGGFGPPPLTAAEVLAHPEFPHTYWELKPDVKGSVEVAKGRGGPLRIAYEIHGRGSSRIVWIMGLGGFKKAWQRQTRDFGHVQADKYSCLILDNRGIGESDKPLLRYTTSEMARDVIELLDHVGWTEDRSVHVVGISMGGMICQELAALIPQRICSLNLISTAPRVVRTIPFLDNVKNRINLVIPKSLDNQVAKVKGDCYTTEWLAKPDETEFVVQAFPTNGDRFAAGELAKRLDAGAFTTAGFICQLYAAGFHHKSAAQLQKIGDEVDRRRILVLHGKQDKMLGFVHAEMLIEGLGGEGTGITMSIHENLGHVAPLEMRKEFNRIIAERIEKTEAMNRE